MSYPIWTGVTTSGEALIGARNVDAARKAGILAEIEQIYGSQFPHRVVGRVGNTWRLMTPTDARELGAVDVRPL